MHDLDIKRINIQSDLTSDFREACTVYQPRESKCFHLHFIVHPFEHQGFHFCTDRAFFRRYKDHILRSYHDIHRFIFTESDIDAFKILPLNIDKAVADHCRRKNIALADKVCHKRILRLIVNVFRRTDLLDVPLIHDDDRIGHRKCLFLIVGNINKRNSEFFFQTDEFVLHPLAHLQVKSTQRFIQKKNLRLIYDGTRDRDTLLLTSTEGIRHTFFVAVKIHQLQRIFNLVTNIVF